LTLSNAWDLLASGNAAQALTAYNELAKRARELTSDRQRCALYINRASALAALGRFGDAAESEMIADRIALSEGVGVRYTLKASQLYWLAGERDRALEMANEDLSAIVGGVTQYADFGGGSSNGLNLLFLSTKLKAEAKKSHAMSFLMNRAKASVHKGWPRPVVQFVLGQSSFQDLLAAASGARTLEEAVATCTTDPLVRRRLSFALFYSAFHSERIEDLDTRRTHLRACVSIPNPISVYEWYMARDELDRAS
jgi:hypothetical protein